MHRIRKRLTYANVMSSLAVFLVLGGATAFAATKIGSNEIKANAITTGKIKKEAVAAGKIKNGAVNSAKLADGAVTASKLASGLVAPTAQRLAHYANVDENGTVLAGSLGVSQANVTRSGGFYCFSGLSPAPVGAVATIDYTNAGAEEVIQTGLGAGPVCPGGTQLFVNPRNGGAVQAGFFVIIY